MYVGVDEAGRGSLIGPLVIAAVRVSSLELLNFVNRDSKQLSREEREELYDRILKVAEVKVYEISPKEIDANNINLLELKVLKGLLDWGEVIYVDAFLPPSSFQFPNVIAEFKADEKYPIVAAASIIAKVTRDRRIEEIKHLVGDFGSGYPSDPVTRKFVRENWELIKPFVRMKWKTVSDFKQKRLVDF
jgi:ribonuclease HII